MPQSLQMIRSSALAAVLIAGFLAFGINSTKAAELLMLEQQGCAWCERWHAEIGPAYPNTSEGKRVPLRLVDINKPWPADLENIRKERFTPTFVLIENGVEISRMRGYTGDEFFWFLLDEMLEKLPVPPKS